MLNLETISHIWNTIVHSNTFNFVIFVLILAWVFKKINIVAIISSLQEKIVKILEEAKIKKEEAKNRLAQTEKAVKNLPEELKSLIIDATKSAEGIEKKLLEDAQKQVESIKTNAQKVIEAEEKMLTSKLTQKASKASVEIARSNINKSLELNPALHEKYINESIDSLDRLNF